jgi:ABC-type transport system substrate-binding protein
MTKPWRMAVVLSAVALVAVMLAVPISIPAAQAINETKDQTQLIFTVGGQDQMKTRNFLPAVANDVWTSDVLGRVYDTVGQTDPNTDALVPYIIKGVDANGDTNFERNEKATFLKNPCPAPCADPVAWRRTVIAYYDFNGVLFHDGTQATVGDVFFNYVLQSLNPRYNTGLRVLWDDPNAASLPASRHLNVYLQWCGPTSTQWEGEAAMAGVNNLRCAVRFQLQDDYALFYRDTLASLTLFPRHIYEGTGGLRHADWGMAIYPESNTAKFGQGVPTDETSPTPLNYPAVEAWQMTDADVIGTGPFKFGTWQFGQFARVDKNPNYFYGVDPSNHAIVYDSDVPKYMHLPFIDSILFKIYRTTALGVLALQSGDIDFYHWNLPPEFVPDLLNDPRIRVWANAEPGFYYLSYNMRRLPFGYTTYPPAPGQDRTSDAGYPFRQAFSHLIDKPTIIRSLLQNYGVVADGVVSPANTFWYNGTLPKNDYNPQLAASLLDNAGWTVGPNGYRVFPRIGDTPFKILTPQADYDPIRASAGAMIAAAAQSIHVNVVATPTAFGAIINSIDARDFDMFILGWRISGTDPDYMFSFFHSSNAASGQNYPGFYDSKFDSVIISSRKELDESKRQSEAKWAQGILSERLPYDVLYYRTNIEAQRSDRFVNFSVAAGSIWNFWSLQSIRQPTSKFIRAVVTAPSAIVQGGTTPVTVTVRDEKGQAVNGATIALVVNQGAGTFNGPGTTCTNVYNCQGTTTSTGTYTAQYTAPASVPALNPDIEIRVTARSPDPEVPTDQKTEIITVFTAGVQFLSVTPQLTTGDLVLTGQSLVFGLDVRDQDGNLANGARVNLTRSPTSATITPSDGQASVMRSNIVFQAPATIASSPQTFLVTVNANQTGYQDGTSSIEFTVVKVADFKTCPDGSKVPLTQACPTQLIPALGIIPVLAVIAVVAVAYTMMKRKKQRRRPGKTAASEKKEA